MKAPPGYQLVDDGLGEPQKPVVRVFKVALVGAVGFALGYYFGRSISVRTAQKSVLAQRAS